MSRSSSARAVWMTKWSDSRHVNNAFVERSGYPVLLHRVLEVGECASVARHAQLSTKSVYWYW